MPVLNIKYKINNITCTCIYLCKKNTTTAVRYSRQHNVRRFFLVPRQQRTTLFYADREFHWKDRQLFPIMIMRATYHTTRVARPGTRVGGGVYCHVSQSLFASPSSPAGPTSSSSSSSAGAGAGGVQTCVIARNTSSNETSALACICCAL